jgi:small subunit ribosomal protein S1
MAEEEKNVAAEETAAPEAAVEVVEAETPVVEDTPEPVPEIDAGVVAYVTSFDDLPDDEDEYSADMKSEFEELYAPTLNVKEGEIVTGMVIRLEGDEAVVDIGFKSEGSVRLNEFADPSAVQVGVEIEVFVESIEDQEGQVVISKQKADFMRVWDRIKDAYDAGLPVSGTLMRRIKGGIVVDLFGVEAFLPGSQIDLRQVKNFEAYLSKTFDFRIIKLNKSRRNIVVSRRVLLEEEREQMRDELLKTLEKDQIREGIVKNITDFGAFIDLGGVDGLLHITDMSWGRISHPSEVVTIGDRVRVKVLNYDKDRGRISLGLKQLQSYPWEGVEERYPVTTQVKGRVVSITDYGAFVEIEEGVEGLIHISEMSWTQHVRHPSKIVSIGDEVDTVVLRVNESEEKISLGLKQTQPDPWETLDERYPIGTRLVGTIRNITNFGVFVEIEPGIDGLVHISDLSWTRRVKHPSEIAKKSEEMPVVILNIDKDQRRISLSHKHCQDNPWDMLEQQYEVGTETVGSVIEITDKGLVVELEGDVEGFIPVSQVGVEEVNNLAEHFNLGEDLNMVVLEFDRDQKRIVLSVRRYYEQKSEDDLAEYLKAHEARPITIAEVVEGEDGEVVDLEVGDEPTGDDADVAAEEVVEEAEVAEDAAEEVEADASKEEAVEADEPAAEEAEEEAVETESDDAVEDVKAEVEADASEEEAVEADEPAAEEAEEEAVEAESDEATSEEE